MKQLLLLVMILLLSGCNSAVNSSESENEHMVSESASEQSVESDTDTSGKPTADAPVYPLPDTAMPLDSSEVLFQIPNAAIEGNDMIDLAMINGNLLVSTVVMPDTAQYAVSMSLYDLQTGELLREHTEPMGIYVPPQIQAGHIVIPDSAAGSVRILDDRFQTVAAYAVPSDWSAWYLGSDLQTLYRFNSSEGIVATDLSSGSEHRLLPPEAKDQMIVASAQDQVAVSYIDPDSQLYTCACLDLNTGVLEEIPFEQDFSTVMRCGDTWFGEAYAALGVYYIGSEREYSVTTIGQTEQLRFLAPQGHLLRTSVTEAAQMLSLYDADRNLLSACALSDFPGCFLDSSKLYWSEAHYGYFFPIYDHTAQQYRLLFWKIYPTDTGDGLVRMTLVEYEASLHTSQSQTTDASLYERAAELSETYQVKILIAEQCPTDYGGRRTARSSDAALIANALDTLEEVFSRYPEGFFSQLLYGHMREVQIQLVGAITDLNETQTQNLYHTVAFQEEMHGHLLIVADISEASADTYHHEISHLIEDRLSWDAYCRKEALFSDSVWLSLSPEGFSYTYSIEGWANDEYVPNTGEYFISGYGQTTPQEDRAEIFEIAMRGDPGNFFRTQEGLRSKLAYYCDCIRDCFDTETWPDVLPWEYPLR